MLLTETWTYGHDLTCKGSRYKHIRGHEEPRVAGKHNGGHLTRGINALTDDAAWEWTDIPHLSTPFTQWLRATRRHGKDTTSVFVGSAYIPGVGRWQNRGERERALQELGRTVEAVREMADATCSPHYIVVGGDLNGRLKLHGDKEENTEGRQILDFAAAYGLTVANGLPIARGGCSFTGSAANTAARQAGRPLTRKAASTPDMILIEEVLRAAMRDVIVEEDDNGIGSDHVPVTISLDIPLTRHNRTATAATHPCGGSQKRPPPKRNDSAAIEALNYQCTRWMRAYASNTCTSSMAAGLAKAIAGDSARQAQTQRVRRHTKPTNGRQHTRRVAANEAKRTIELLQRKCEAGDAAGIWTWLR